MSDESSSTQQTAANDAPATAPSDALDSALSSLELIDQIPLEAHAERYRAVHADLQQALTDTDTP